MKNLRRSKINSWRFPIIDITKICKKCKNCKDCSHLWNAKPKEPIEIIPEQAGQLKIS